jgi:hypothetical protein
MAYYRNRFNYKLRPVYHPNNNYLVKSGLRIIRFLIISETQLTACFYWFLIGLFCYPEDGDDISLRNVELLTHHTAVLFTVTTVRTSSPTHKIQQRNERQQQNADREG